MFDNDGWAIISNVQLKKIPHKHYLLRIGNFFLYSGKCLNDLDPTNRVMINIHNIEITNIDDELKISGLDKSVIAVDRNGFEVNTSENNTNPIYYYLNRNNGIIALFSNIFLSRYLFESLNSAPSFIDSFTYQYNELTPIRDIYRFEYGLHFQFNSDFNSFLTKRSFCTWPKDKLITDCDQAGKLLLDAIYEVMESYAKNILCADLLLSGGIDSATSAYFALKAGISLNAYTVASPWGDEFGNAKETADYLGINLKKVSFTEEQLLTSLSDSIYFLEGYDEDLVDIGLTNCCFLRFYSESKQCILTGYGSDLLNAGYFKTKPTKDTIHQMINESIFRTRYTSEFSSKLSICYNRQILHPFWEKSVQQVAYRVSPSIKWVDGQDKYMFRNAMEKYYPKSIAWRKKVAVHQGNLMQQGLNDLIRKRFSNYKNKHELYQTIFKKLFELEFSEIGKVDCSQIIANL